jgi:hypothetical protein
VIKNKERRHKKRDIVIIALVKDTANPSQLHLIASPYNRSSLQALAPVGIRRQKIYKGSDSLKEKNKIASVWYHVIFNVNANS